MHSAERSSAELLIPNYLTGFSMSVPDIEVPSSNQQSLELVPIAPL